MGLIGKISIDPKTVRPGEAALIRVLGGDGEAIDESRVSVTISGVPGAVQCLQFPTAGQRRVTIAATSGTGESAQQTATIDVAGEPVTIIDASGTAQVAMLSALPAYGRPYEVVLTLGPAAEASGPRLPLVHPMPIGRLTRKAASEIAASLSSTGRLGAVLTTHRSQPVKFETRRLAAPTGKGTTPYHMETAVVDLDAAELATLTSQIADNYDWDFGDGTKASSSGRTIRHDFFAGIGNHSRGFGQFTVTCTERHSGVTAKRTLTLRSAYAICKERGVIVPHVVADDFAHKRDGMLAATFTVHNVEDQPLMLDQVSVTAQANGPVEVAIPNAFRRLENAVTVAPRGQAVIAVNIPFVAGAPQNGQLAYDASGFSVVYGGRVGEVPVRCSAHFDVPLAERNWLPPAVQLPNVPLQHGVPVVVWPWEPVMDLVAQYIDRGIRVVDPGESAARGTPVTIDAGTGTMAIAAGPIGTAMTATGRRAVDQLVGAIYAPVESGRTMLAPVNGKIIGGPAAAGGAVAGRAGGSLGSLAGRQIQAFDGPPPPGLVAEGQVCDPDNLTEDDLAAADAGQLVCQRTEEVVQATMPGRWMNARKGDVILSPGGTGLIGEMMLNVTPSQIYSHCGIMTRNYDQITHSTGSEERLLDHLVGFHGGDGFDPLVLKYVWPGAITQSVENSIQTEPFPDPELPKKYLIGAFKPHTVHVTHDSMYVIPPLVVKPDPMLETTAVRTSLHAIATDCANDAGGPGKVGKYHYRWYSYTDPTPGLNGQPADAEAGWAEGTLPSVCSAFVWIHARKRGAHLESGRDTVETTDLEPSDVRGPDSLPAKIRSGTPEGLYLYSADERLKAGEWLRNEIYNEAYDKAQWYGDLLTDGADDVSNQFLNAFATDDCDGKDSEDWRNAKDATAVSPDDLLWWDGPDKGGLWGYAEPAIYREPRVESYTVSRWKLVRTRGRIHGRVTDAEGQPAAGAMVAAYDGKTAFCATDGSYALDDMPFGPYQLKAQKVVAGVLESAQADVSIEAADLTADIQLKQPEERFRLAQFSIDFYGVDDEWAADDEIDDPAPEYFELELGPDRTTNLTQREYKWGGELRVVYEINATLLANNAINVAIYCRLYEGTTEHTTDLDGHGSLSFDVPAGASKGSWFSVTNTDEDADDRATLSVSVTNARNNN